MIHVRKEGGVLANGFNFYPLSDKWNKGFVFRLGSFRFRFRWSAFRGCFFISAENSTKSYFGFMFPKPRDRSAADSMDRLMDGISVEQVN